MDRFLVQNDNKAAPNYNRNENYSHKPAPLGTLRSLSFSGLDIIVPVFLETRSLSPSSVNRIAILVGFLLSVYSIRDIELFAWNSTRWKDPPNSHYYNAADQAQDTIFQEPLVFS